MKQNDVFFTTSKYQNLEDEQIIEQIKQGDSVIGNKTTVKIVKNKVAPPFKTAVVEIMYGEGVSRVSEIIDLGVDFDIIEKSGSWYSYNSQRLGQGKENIKDYLKQNPEVCDEIEAKIREKLKNNNSLTISSVDEDEVVEDGE